MEYQVIHSGLSESFVSAQNPVHEQAREEARKILMAALSIEAQELLKHLYRERAQAFDDYVKAKKRARIFSGNGYAVV